MANSVGTHQSRAWRRSIALVAVLALGLATLAACGGGSSTSSEGGTEAESGPIEVAAVTDQTGQFNVYGKPKLAALELAVDDINANGGLLGREVDLVVFDSQSDPAKAAELANEAVLKDEVAGIFGVVSSASRDAVHAQLANADTPFFHTISTEGGMCAKNVMSLGVDADQQFSLLIPYAVETYGPRAYVLGADYAYGRNSGAHAKVAVEEAGGEVVGEQYVPLTNSDFGAVLSDIQKTKPDFVITTLVGANQLEFYPQFAARGLNGSIGIVSNSFGVGGEQGLFGDAAAGILTAYPYYQELENPANEEFIELWKEGGFDKSSPYISQVAMDEWNALQIWAEAVESAGSAEPEAVIAALEEDGTSYDGPSGATTVDPPTHHAVLDLSIGEVNDEGGYDILETVDAVQPAYTQTVCDLVGSPDTDEVFVP